MKYVYIFLALLTAALGFCCYLFWVQNQARTTQLSLDIGVTAFQLQQPVQVPALMLICTALGLCLGMLLPVILRSIFSSRSSGSSSYVESGDVATEWRR